MLPVRDGAAHLGEQLAALAGQSYSGPWELVVVDNGSRDSSLAIVRGHAHRLPGVRVIDASARRNLNYARNAGAEAAAGDLLAFCDSDDVADLRWLEALVDAASQADVVGGRLEFELLNKPEIRSWRPDDPMTGLPVIRGWLPFVPGGNCAVWADVARSVGWDEAFAFGGSDKEFSWRVQLAEHRVAFASDAVIHQRYRQGLRAMARQYYAYGRAGPQLYRSFRDSGMPRDLRKALSQWRWLVRHPRLALGSRQTRGRWVRLAAFHSGSLIGSVRARVLYL